MTNGTKVLVTGASGYIGSSIVKALPAQQVIATTRRPTPELASDLGVPVIELDVLNTDVLNIDVLRRFRAITTVIHCATANDILSSDFAAGVNLSVHGTWQMLNLAKRLGASHFLFVSTFQVYGTELKGLITEDTAVCCETPYALNHFMGEETCRMFSRAHGLRISILRPANIFGVPVASTVDRMSLVPMCFVRDALQTGRLLLKSSGQQQRNFISLSKVAEMCLRVALLPSDEQFSIYNICSSWEISIREIADMTCEVHKEIFDKILPIEVQSTSNEYLQRFTASSKLHIPASLREDLRQSMKKTIADLFIKMSSETSYS
jgi:UDP-glucose 4-epimerase